MSNKFFWGIISALVIGASTYIFVQQNSKTEEVILGAQHADQGQKHVQDGSKAEYNSNPPSSGDHYQSPAPKGFYDQEIPDGTLIHNLEHGYVWIAYRPDLPTEQIQKLKSLFRSPFSDPKFTPSKAIIAPRPNNPAPISIVSWRWTINLDGFDKDKLKQFYLQHVSKSPEAAAS